MIYTGLNANLTLLPNTFADYFYNNLDKIIKYDKEKCVDLGTTIEYYCKFGDEHEISMVTNITELFWDILNKSLSILNECKNIPEEINDQYTIYLSITRGETRYVKIISFSKQEYKIKERIVIGEADDLYERERIIYDPPFEKRSGLITDFEAVFVKDVKDILEKLR